MLTYYLTMAHLQDKFLFSFSEGFSFKCYHITKTQNTNFNKSETDWRPVIWKKKFKKIKTHKSFYVCLDQNNDKTVFSSSKVQTSIKTLNNFLPHATTAPEFFSPSQGGRC